MTTVIRELKADDLEDFCRFMTEQFYRHEPCLQTPGFEPVIYDSPENRESDLAVIQQGLSIVAVDPNNNDRIVGTAFAEAMVSSDLEKKWMKVNEKKPTGLLDHIFYFIANLERRAQVFELYNVPNALYLNIIAVDSSMGCQGIGRRLVSALIDKGRSRGFPLLATCCTSLYSTRVMLAVGMDCVLSEAYANYTDEEGNVILRPPTPHTAANVLAIKL